MIFVKLKGIWRTLKHRIALTNEGQRMQIFQDDLFTVRNVLNSFLQPVGGIREILRKAVHGMISFSLGPHYFS